ncbi:MAG: O-antigen ligase family protein [Gammaproteobacteria bacterium]|nr:O-antigen ligase family protein [Gammaproteobacteria bacterium]
MGEDDTSLQRMAYWYYGIDIMNKNPVLGIGYFNWLDYMYFVEPTGVGPKQIIEIPHNTFIQAGAELGYTGLVVFLAIIVTLLALNSSTRKIVKDNNALLFYITYGLDAGLIGLLVGAFFIAALYYPFFWIQFALTVTVHSVARAEYGYVRKAAGDVSAPRLDSNG